MMQQSGSASRPASRWRKRAPCIQISRWSPEDIDADAVLIESIADWCLRYTPLVACNTPDGLLLDISGCAHLYGGEHELVADLGSRLEDAGFAYSLAIAGTIGAAWAVSRHGEPASYACGEERALLTPLPLSALRLPPATIAGLARVGLKCIGDIVDLPRAPLTARFGPEVLRQLDRALGHEHEPLTPRLPVAPYAAEERFAEPIAREEDVLAITERLARRLQFALERRGDGARRIELSLFRTDGVVRRIAAGTSRPLRNPGEIRALFVERLTALADVLDPGFGFDMARLSVVVAEPAPPEQIGIAGGQDAAELCRLVDRLSARLGARRVRRLAAQDSHIPELAEAALPAQAVNDDAGWDAFRRYRKEIELSPRPLRLLSRPEPIEAVAEVPGWTALALPVAARPARGNRRRRPRAHRGRLVERDTAGPRAITSAWRTRAVCVSGSSVRDFIATSRKEQRRQPGSCTGHLREV